MDHGLEQCIQPQFLERLPTSDLLVSLWDKERTSAHVVRLGSRVAIICIIPTDNGSTSTRATVSIDGGAAVSVSHVTTPPVQYAVVLWDSGPLPFANHLVTLTNAGTEAYLRFDRADYDPTDSNAPISHVTLSYL